MHFSLLRAVIVLCILHSALGLKRSFHIDKSDERPAILLEDFGFTDSGVLSVKIKNNLESEGLLRFAILSGHNSFSPPVFTDTDVCDPQDDIDRINGAIASVNSRLYVEFTSDKTKIEASKGTVFTDVSNNYLQAGYYFTYLLRCEKGEIDADFDFEQYNIGSNGSKNYLSAGIRAVPAIIFVFAVLWIALAGIWAVLILRGRKKVNRVHIFLAVYICLSVLTLFFQYGTLVVQRNEGGKGGMSVPYFMFTITRGILFFVLIIIIGSGMSFVKKHLGNKERVLIFTVIVIQIVANIAFVLCQSLPKTSPSRTTWLSVFRLCDLVCCCFVVVPVLWSINTLRKQAALTPVEERTDSSQTMALTKLTLFQRYYLFVIGYVYLKIIVIYLLNLYINYKAEWVIDFFDQLLSLAFYCLVCFLFRPEAENPFIQFEQDDYVAPTLFENEMVTKDNQEEHDEENVKPAKVQNSALLIDDDDIRIDE